MAVVDINALCRDCETVEDFHLIGPNTKLYAFVDGAWKRTAHWVALLFDDD